MSSKSPGPSQHSPTHLATSPSATSQPLVIPASHRRRVKGRSLLHRPEAWERHNHVVSPTSRRNQEVLKAKCSEAYFQLQQTSRISTTKEAKYCDGTEASTGMVRRGGDAARVKALHPVDATYCWHLLCWWWPCFLGALPPSLWSKNNSSKESQVGIMRSNLYELDISLACAALQPGV